MQRQQTETSSAPPVLPNWIMKASLYGGRIGGGLVFLMAFPITIDVLTRKLLSVSFLESYEISTYAFAIAVAFGYSYALLAGAHIRIDVVYARLRRGPRAALDVFALILLSGVAILVAWQAGFTAAESFRIGARSNSTLGAPLALPQGLWAAGLAFFALICCLVTLRVAWLAVLGQHQRKEALMDGSAMRPFESGASSPSPGEDRAGEARTAP